jgi:predicted nucleic acid-binding protein
VCDASALVAVLLDDGDDGRWANGQVAGAELAGPSLVGYEAANIIRRHELAEIIGQDQAKQAHADLLDMTIEQWPREAFATRAFQLRRNLSIYDASHVALAELIEAKLVTLDRRISRATGPRCVIATPEHEHFAPSDSAGTP